MTEDPLWIAQRRKREKLFPTFFQFCRGLRAAVVDFYESGSDDPLYPEGIQRVTKELGDANCVSSLVLDSGSDTAETDSEWWDSTRHKPVLDIDIPCLLLDSSTPGHHHLIIDKEMPWWKYKNLLLALADAGIIEPGFAHASINRNSSWVRVPWEKKNIVNNGKGIMF